MDQKHCWRRQMVGIIAAVLILTSLMTAGSVIPAARAQGPNHATLLVVFAPNDIFSSCIVFNEAEISGAELLARSGLTVLAQSVAGVGVTVCKIDNTGCDFPGQACFCQCLGASCNYWSYWTWHNGAWVYSGRGASQSAVLPGGINAWVWGDGQNPPPAVGDEGACGASAILLTASSTPVPPSVAQYDPYPAGSVTATPVSAVSETPINNAMYPDPNAATAQPSMTPAQTGVATITLTGTTPITATPSGTATSAPATATPTAAPPSATPLNPTVTPDRSASVIAQVAANRALTSVPTVAPAAAEKRSYWAFAGIALLLLLAIAYVLLLRRQHSRGR
jgi:hypothetical protein